MRVITRRSAGLNSSSQPARFCKRRRKKTPDNISEASMLRECVGQLKAISEHVGIDYTNEADVRVSIETMQRLDIPINDVGAGATPLETRMCVQNPAVGF